VGWPINFKNGREMCRVASPSGYILCIGVLPQILYIVEYLLSTHVGVGFTPTIVDHAGVGTGYVSTLHTQPPGECERVTASASLGYVCMYLCMYLAMPVRFASPLARPLAYARALAAPPHDLHADRTYLHIYVCNAADVRFSPGDGGTNHRGTKRRGASAVCFSSVRAEVAEQAVNYISDLQTGPSDSSGRRRVTTYIVRPTVRPSTHPSIHPACRVDSQQQCGVDGMRFPPPPALPHGVPYVHRIYDAHPRTRRQRCQQVWQAGQAGQAASAVHSSCTAVVLRARPGGGGGGGEAETGKPSPAVARAIGRSRRTGERHPNTFDSGKRGT